MDTQDYVAVPSTSSTGPAPTALRVTLSPYEMGTLIAAARWVLEGGEGELTAEARTRIEQVLEN